MPAVTAVTETREMISVYDRLRLFAHQAIPYLGKTVQGLGGGVALFVRNDIHAEQVLINCEYYNLEVICVDLTLNSHKIQSFNMFLTTLLHC